MKKRITSAKQRICVECGEVLRNQQRSHLSEAKYRQEQRQGRKYPTRYCSGPSSTPVPPSSSRRRRLPVHFRYYAGEYVSLCGLRAGRTAGRWKSEDAEVSYSRVNVKLEQTTCIECLVRIAEDAEAKLTGVSAADRAKALEQAHARSTMNKVRQLVTS